VDRPALRQAQPHTLEEVSVDVADGRLAEQVLQLIEDEEDTRAGGEADDHRMRDVPGQITEPEQADAELDRPDEQRQQHRGLHAVPGCGDSADRAQQRDRDGIGRPVDELARRVEQRADRGHHNRGVEPILRGQPRDHRVAIACGMATAATEQPATRSARASVTL
jgi:hypothetical protein